MDSSTSLASTGVASTGLVPPIGNGNGARPRRRSALAIAERVTALVSLRRGSFNTQSRSASQSGSDAVSPQSPTTSTSTSASARSRSSSTLHLPGTTTNNGNSRGNTTTAGILFGLARGGRSSNGHGPSHDPSNSACTTDREDDRERDENTSDDVHSAEDSFEFGLLEGDPFANLSAPPSICHSPVSRLWLRTLSSDVIAEEPEDKEDGIGASGGKATKKRLGPTLGADLTASPIGVPGPDRQQPPSPLSFDDQMGLHSRWSEDHDDDGVPTNFPYGAEIMFPSRERHHSLQGLPMPSTPPNTRAPTSNGHDGPAASSLSVNSVDDRDAPERRRSNSFTQRVRSIVQSRPSLPSLSILANTKIFLPSTSMSKSGLASRFPSEPWDDPMWSSSASLSPNPDLTPQPEHVKKTPSRTGESSSSSSGGGQWRSGAASNGGGFGGRSRGSANPSSNQRGGGAGGSGDDGRDWQPPNKRNFEPSSGYQTARETTSDDEEDESDSDSDDMPLGQRPNALVAQKSLRRKIKDERRSRKETIKQTTHSLVPPPVVNSGKERQVRLSADDLTARLLNLRPSTGSVPASPTGRTAFPTLPNHPPAGSNTASPKTSNEHQYPYQKPFTPPQTYDAPKALPGKSQPTSPTMIQNPTFAFPSRGDYPPGRPSISRHATDSRAHHNMPATPETAKPQFPQRSMTSFDSPRPSNQFTSPMSSRRPSHDVASKPTIPAAAPSRTRADTLVGKMGMASDYVSKVRQRATSLKSPNRLQHAQAAHVLHPALPPLPTNALRGASAPRDSGDSVTNGAMLMQQRIFVGSMQRFSVIEIGPRTNAREVINTIAERGDLSSEEVRQGGWMLFEMAKDFGMERPIREFELVMEVYNSWNSETRVNYFMLRQTNLEPLLAVGAVPKMSPTFGGWVEWEQRRGKWTKRWLELREHGLWLSKRQGLKDATVLCTLANFDVYTVTRIHKSPKPFIFSIKSVQNMRMFENLSDYHHVFCCDPTEGSQWLQNILLARSYVLHQERTVLFRALEQSQPSAPPQRLARMSTKRAPPAPLLLFDRNAPLPTAPAPGIPQTSGSAAPDSFQPAPGSLLAKRI